MSRINRRDFIKQTSAGAGLALNISDRSRSSTFRFRRNNSPNERIAIGFIGVGARAQQVMAEVLNTPGFELVAFCDAYQGRIQRATERTGGRAQVYKNHHELLAAPGIDAVYIGTPDHLHKEHAIAALEAGKDVYIEKPLTYKIDDGLEIIAAVKKSGRILQVGSQNISTPLQLKAREIVKSGRLGQITMIRTTTNRNTPGGAWIYPIPPDANEQTVNWQMFEGVSPKHPFSLERFFRWRCYREYSGGIATDLLVHTMTTIHFVMGAEAPACVVAAGDLYRWKDSRNVPDTLNALLQYPEGFTVNLSATFNNQSSEHGIEILGTKGTLTIGRELTITPEEPIDDNSWVVASWSRALEEAYYKSPKVRDTEEPQRWDPKTVQTGETWRGLGRDSTALHLERFQKAVKERSQPVEDVFAGHRAAAVAHMINASASQKKPIFWDRSRDNVKA
ncbi:MAG: Gfo/Idh/MocA family oxidoreductase [Blastocatellia bacterium]|nr:Gfo/Idh/MocA family oxidoreductase [Blastocatellia bacterium]